MVDASFLEFNLALVTRAPFAPTLPRPYPRYASNCRSRVTLDGVSSTVRLRSSKTSNLCTTSRTNCNETAMNKTIVY